MQGNRKMEEQRTIEIRAAEGGADARLFAAELAVAYAALAARRGWLASWEKEPDLRSGNQTVRLSLTGREVSRMDAEAGGHRVQRVPATERSGRVHSSTVTVAVLEPGTGSCREHRPSSDFEETYYSGTGAGGQNRNKVQACCRIRHLPTGIVRTAQTRSRENSRQLAMQAMLEELDRQEACRASTEENGTRKLQVGSGERSDRRRTWAFQRDSVEDFVTGKSIRCGQAMKGHLDRLWV